MAMFIKKISPFIDKPYKAGGTSIEGFDCLGLTVRLLNRLGKYPPESMGELDVSNYWKPFEKEPDKIRGAMEAYFDSFARRIEPAYCLAGDIVVCEVAGNHFCGLYGGNALVITVLTNEKVRPVRIGSKIRIITAWRFGNGS